MSRQRKLVPIRRRRLDESSPPALVQMKKEKRTYAKRTAHITFGSHLFPAQSSIAAFHILQKTITFAGV
jgi:hypothetical protein